MIPERARTGEVTEWPIVLVSKTSVLQGTGGSNPPLSARF